jgi:SAM-dependent methyltransferase
MSFSLSRMGNRLIPRQWRSIVEERRLRGASFAVAGGTLRLRQPARNRLLRLFSMADIGRELLARLEAGQSYETLADLALANRLQYLLDDAIDLEGNRFSAVHHANLIRPILEVIPRSRLTGATVVDLGCGSLTPFALSFLLLMLGARRAYAIDVDPVQDPRQALRALVTCASWLLTDPGRILGRERISPEEVLGNLRGFDLRRLAAGDPGGLAIDRLLYLNQSTHDLTVPDGDVDFVFSVAVLEHLERPAETIESMRRMTRAGGYGYHVVDFVDHRTYGDPTMSPFEFLKIPARDGLVHGCNRLRCSQLCELFERQGFVVERVDTWTHGDISPHERAQLAEPYCSMPAEQLNVLIARLLVRRL